MSTVLTGGAGFIGSNLLRALNRAGHEDVIVVDRLDHPGKQANLAGAEVQAVLDVDEFRSLVAQRSPRLDGVTSVIHQGACTVTDHPDDAWVMDVNYTASMELLAFCTERSIPLVYASSAAVYGPGVPMAEVPRCEQPLTTYAESKLRFDEQVRAASASAQSQVVGLRYFNVYGPREDHKGRMASLVTQLDLELAAGRAAVLFDASHGFGPGQHRRDFVHVDDVTSVILWFLGRRDVSGIFNCGTGESSSFQDLAEAVVRFHGGGAVTYRPMPPPLVATYQAETCADLTRLRAVGCDHVFRSLDVGVKDTLAWRSNHRNP